MPRWDFIGLAVALGAGLLIGLERERRKGQGPTRGAAGLRTFALTALAGGVAQWLEAPALVAIGALAVVLLAGVAYWYGRRLSDDPGLTTEVALFVTYLIGVLAVRDPAIGAACAVVVAVLLAARERLHRFATRVLTEQEMHDGLLLAAFAIVVLPLLPTESQALLGGLSARRLLLLFVLVLSLQALGHVALRIAGARAGLPLAGFFAGFVSSTATVASMGAKAHARAEWFRPAAAGAMLSTSATWIQAVLVLAVVSPSLFRAGWSMFIAGAGTAALTGIVYAMRSTHESNSNDTDNRDAIAASPLRLREAALVAFLLAGVNVVVVQAEHWLGLGGALIASAIAALADAHSSIAATGALHAGGRLNTMAALSAVLLAVAANAAVRIVVAWVSGGRRFGAWIAASLVLSTAAAAFAVWLSM